MKPLKWVCGKSSEEGDWQIPEFPQHMRNWRGHVLNSAFRLDQPQSVIFCSLRISWLFSFLLHSTHDNTSEVVPVASDVPPAKMPDCSEMRSQHHQNYAFHILYNCRTWREIAHCPRKGGTTANTLLKEQVRFQHFADIRLPWTEMEMEWWEERRNRNMNEREREQCLYIQYVMWLFIRYREKKERGGGR